jgi:hypothetical protein
MSDYCQLPPSGTEPPLSEMERAVQETMCTVMRSR